VSSLYFIQIYSPYQILVVMNSQSIPVISRAIFLLTSPLIVDLIAINPPYIPINHQKSIISTIYDFSQWYPHVIPTIPPCLLFKSLFPWQHRDTPQLPWQRHFPGWGRKLTSRRCPRESGIPQDMGPETRIDRLFFMFRGIVRCELRNFNHDNWDLWIFLGIRYYNMFAGSV
jgi:hypothetical protein